MGRTVQFPVEDGDPTTKHASGVRLEIICALVGPQPETNIPVPANQAYRTYNEQLSQNRRLKKAEH